MAAAKTFYATGKRKTSTARVWLKDGSGQMVVNSRTLDEYFTREVLKKLIYQPLDLTGKTGKFDLYKTSGWKRRTGRGH